jgi:hypothetical protein
MNAIFMVWQHRVHVIEIPNNSQSPGYKYDYARQKLGVKEEDITPWGELNMKDGVARFNYLFN